MQGAGHTAWGFTSELPREICNLKFPSDHVGKEEKEAGGIHPNEDFTFFGTWHVAHTCSASRLGLATKATRLVATAVDRAA